MAPRLPRTSCPAAACTPSPESGISGASPRCGRQVDQSASAPGVAEPSSCRAACPHQGKVIGPGNWEPILDADTLHGITAFLNDPSRKNAVAFERRHLLHGIAKCGICGSALYAQPPYSSCAGGRPARRGRSPKAPLWRGGVGGSTSRPSEVFLLDDVRRRSTPPVTAGRCGCRLYIGPTIDRTAPAIKKLIRWT